MTYPEPITRWFANITEAYERRITPLDIIETERRYPGLLDDILAQLGYRSYLRRKDDA